MSQSIPTGYISRGLAQKTCPGGRDLTFEICPGAGNSTRTGILWKMEMKLQKTAWIKFLQVKQKTSWIFDLFRGLRAFSMEFFLVYGSISLVLLSHIPHKKSEELPLACLHLKFSLGYGYPHVLLYKKLWLCWTFCPCIGFISDKYRVSQTIAKNGEHCIVDFQFKLC